MKFGFAIIVASILFGLLLAGCVSDTPTPPMNDSQKNGSITIIKENNVSEPTNVENKTPTKVTSKIHPPPIVNRTSVRPVAINRIINRTR